MIEKLQNANSFFDTKIPIDDRTPTFENNIPTQLLSSQELLNVPQAIVDNINKSMKQIRDHIMENSKIDIQGGKFYFKTDRKTDNLVLFFATNLSVYSESKSPHQVCIGNSLYVKILAWKRK